VAIQIAGSKAESFRATRTSPGELFQPAGQVDVKAGALAYSAPAGSVTTFVARQSARKRFSCRYNGLFRKLRSSIGELMPSKRTIGRILTAALGAALFQFTTTAQNAGGGKLPTQPYTWKSVQMVGAGFVDGFVFHPTAKGVRYARTDMGGAYRWNDAIKRWEPILDWVSYPDVNLMGVESIALDPADPNRVYLACGTYTNARSPNGAILRSNDRGKTFQRTDVPFKFGGNENGRGNGERMAVDPHDGSILYLGTRQAGLWRSTDRAVTWSKVDRKSVV
jgi:hypothetical protein